MLKENISQVFRKIYLFDYIFCFNRSIFTWIYYTQHTTLLFDTILYNRFLILVFCSNQCYMSNPFVSITFSHENFIVYTDNPLFTRCTVFILCPSFWNFGMMIFSTLLTFPMHLTYSLCTKYFSITRLLIPLAVDLLCLVLSFMREYIFNLRNTPSLKGEPTPSSFYQAWDDFFYWSYDDQMHDWRSQASFYLDLTL